MRNLGIYSHATLVPLLQHRRPRFGMNSLGSASDACGTVYRVASMVSSMYKPNPELFIHLFCIWARFRALSALLIRLKYRRATTIWRPRAKRTWMMIQMSTRKGKQEYVNGCWPSVCCVHRHPCLERCSKGSLASCTLEYKRQPPVDGPWAPPRLIQILSNLLFRLRRRCLMCIK